MSRHSKWATIKRAKGIADNRRGMAFTKLSNAITIAVKQTGIADPESNFKLRLAIDAARALNMPKENIERAIQNALGKNAGEVQEVIYEGFAPEGISVIIEAATDNIMRTAAEIKSIFNKEGGNFGQPGSVAYQFQQKGIIIAPKENKTMDELFEMAVDSGAEDIEDIGDRVVITTSFTELAAVRKKLIGKKLTLESAETIREPLNPITILDPEKLQKVQNFLQKLEDLDDVQKVYSNLSVNQ